MLNQTDSEIIEYRYPNTGATFFVLKSEDGGYVGSYRNKEEAMLTAAALGLDVGDDVRKVDIDLFSALYQHGVVNSMLH